MHFPPDQTKCISHLPGLLHLLGHEATAVQLTLSHVPSPEDTIFVSFSCNCFCTSKIIFTFLQALQAGQGIPTGQPGHLLVKTETGQYQVNKSLADFENGWAQE